MAWTHIHQIKKTLSKALAYIENPDKTSDFLLMTGYNCDPISASLEFTMTAEMAKRVNGEYEKTGGSNILAHHLIQSFDNKDKVTAEQAHEIGRKWANEILQGKYEYVITTHVDKGHTHNHVIFNATSFYDYHKYETVPYKTASEMRETSDRLCEEYGLSVIRNPSKSKGRTQYEAKQYGKGTSWKESVKQSIDKAIERTRDYEGFREELKKEGIEILSGARITFHKIGVESKNGRAGKVRGDRIGEEYSRERIIERLAEPRTKERKKVYAPKQKTNEQQPVANATEAREQVFRSYDKEVERQARQTRLAATKELAATLMTIRTENIAGYDGINTKLTELQGRAGEVRGTIKTIEEKSAQYKKAAKYLHAYKQYFPVYQELQKQTVFSKSRYESKYSGELAAFKHAAEQLEKMGVNTTVDPDKVMGLVKEQDGRVAELSGNLKNVDERIMKLRQAQEIVKRIANDEKESDRQRKKEIEL
jgi:Relaxase/Mobilisation nuclease domain.